jgi:hypothetical protein
MYTSVAIALVALYAPSVDQRSSWSANYWQARKLGQQQGKPVAVIVGEGQSGFERLSREGWSPAVQKTLQESYVCVYADRSTREGRSLADALAINTDVGVVLSDRTGEIQAFHHDGALPERELVQRLQHFADPNVVVEGTVTNHRVSYYQPPPAYDRPFITIPASGGRNC